ncbi:MAG TPA: tyrosine--tRNA ligase [Halanaerobiales bacterium]|nr:tyrosine--tRNA ligase [Halanaerobiales bacterium]HPZ62533.1 tyrosine--tRNA ligase [Halanaerobiales bacterium]HQD03752.1 tyrosine--tRNA ligase [Halanaerobiales bacterium]
MENVFDYLKERGFIAQSSNEDEVREILNNKKITLYCGYDPTADSLHIGHFITLMALRHLQKAGHRVITLIGGGTASIGDPSGKDEMRKMLSFEELERNAAAIKEQIAKFLDFSDGKAIMVNNADWLRELEYLPFLKDIAVHFSVNRMLSAECYKSRMEKGLTLLEFNYLVLQSYDFLQLYRNYDCVLQVGGDDQWSNMLGGIDLIRKKERATVNVLTFNLLTTSEGKKMGKTEKGALFLDPEKTTPYDFYQYWRNIDDGDVEKCLALLTDLPMEEVRRLGSLQDEEINKAKEVLAFEVTKLIHGEEEAKKAEKAARALFSDKGSLAGSIPSSEIEKEKFAEGYYIVRLLKDVGLVSSNSEARRLIQQGGIYINNEVINDIDLDISLEHFDADNKLLIRRGKKNYHLIKLI